MNYIVYKNKETGKTYVLPVETKCDTYNFEFVGIENNQFDAALMAETAETEHPRLKKSRYPCRNMMKP